MKKQLLSLAAVAFLSVSGTAQANLLTAGDFEGLAPGQTDLNILNTAVFGEWNVEGTNGVTGNAFGVTAFGSQMMRFDQTGGGNAQTQQYVSGTFAAGSTVDYSVQLNGSSSGATGALFFNAFNGGSIVATYNQIFSLDASAISWETLSVSGLVASAFDKIEVQVYFNNSGLTGGRRGFMDNAVLEVTPPTPVPAPLSLVLMLSGLLGLTSLRRFNV